MVVEGSDLAHPQDAVGVPGLTDGSTRSHMALSPLGQLREGFNTQYKKYLIYGTFIKVRQHSPTPIMKKNHFSGTVDPVPSKGKNKCFLYYRPLPPPYGKFHKINLFD